MKGNVLSRLCLEAALPRALSYYYYQHVNGKKISNNSSYYFFFFVNTMYSLVELGEMKRVSWSEC